MKKIIFKIGISVGVIFISLQSFGQASQPQVIDGFYERELHKDKGVIEYDPVRESDVFWEKRIWRVIDIREKMNLFFSYPKERFIEILLNSTELER